MILAEKFAGSGCCFPLLLHAVKGRIGIPLASQPCDLIVY